MFSLDIINFYLFIGASLRIPGSQGTGFFKYPVRKLLSLCADNNMGAGNSFGVEPPVISSRDLEGQLLILVVVFSNIDIKSVSRTVVIGTAGDFRFFGTKRTFFYKSEFHQFFFDLNQIFFTNSNIQCGADGFQMIDFLFCFCSQSFQSFAGTLQLVISGVIFPGIFLGGQLRIQRNFYFFPAVVVQTQKLLFSAGKLVAVGI